jgi:VanZ family protein
LNTDRHQVLKAWIAAILWLIVIAIESTAYLSAHNTSRFLFPLHALSVRHQLGTIRAHGHFFIRKGGHVVGYGLLCILLFRAWRETLTELSRILSGLCAGPPRRARNCAGRSLDEWHQSFIPSRTGTVRDVILDTCAGIGAQILVLLWVKLF